MLKTSRAISLSLSTLRGMIYICGIVLTVVASFLYGLACFFYLLAVWPRVRSGTGPLCYFRPIIAKRDLAKKTSQFYFFMNASKLGVSTILAAISALNYSPSSSYPGSSPHSHDEMDNFLSYVSD